MTTYCVFECHSALVFQPQLYCCVSGSLLSSTLFLETGSCSREEKKLKTQCTQTAHTQTRLEFSWSICSK